MADPQHVQVRNDERKKALAVPIPVPINLADLLVPAARDLPVKVVGRLADLSIEVALVPDGQHEIATYFVPAKWGPKQTAKLQIGPDAGTVSLAPGLYRTWARVGGILVYPCELYVHVDPLADAPPLP